MFFIKLGANEQKGVLIKFHEILAIKSSSNTIIFISLPTQPLQNSKTWSKPHQLLWRGFISKKIEKPKRLGQNTYKGNSKIEKILVYAWLEPRVTNQLLPESLGLGPGTRDMPAGPSKSASRQRLSISLKRDERKLLSECFANSETTARQLNSRIASRSCTSLWVPEKLLMLK